MSVKYLLKAESQIAGLLNLESRILSHPESYRPPIIESLLNLCNAYFFQEKNDLAIRYAKKSTELCHKVLTLIDSVSLQNPFDDIYLASSKIHFTLLLMQGYTINGQILENERHYNVAYNNYKQARGISMVINGPEHQSTIELTIALNRTLASCKREPRFNFSEKDVGNQSAFLQRYAGSTSPSSSPIAYQLYKQGSIKNDTY